MASLEMLGIFWHIFELFQVLSEVLTYASFPNRQLLVSIGGDTVLELGFYEYSCTKKEPLEAKDWLQMAQWFEKLE